MNPDRRPPLFVAQVLFDYDAQASEEITLKEGQFCHILETNDAGWWHVREANCGASAKLGWAPSNFLRRLDADEIGLAAGIQVISPQHKPSQQKPSVNRNCNQCKLAISSSFALAEGHSYHVACFTCTICNVGLAGNQYFMKDSRPYCDKDYFERFGQICSACSNKIYGPVVSALNKHWHPEHFLCNACKRSIAGTEFFVGTDGQPYCANDYARLFGAKCASCQQLIDGSAFEVQGASYHVHCFCCSVDQALISESDPFHIHDGAIYCLSHFQERFLNRCECCQLPVFDQFLQVLGKSYHTNCFRCKDCDTILSSGQFQVFNDRFVCGTCAHVKRARKARENEAKQLLSVVNVQATPVPNNTSSNPALAKQASAVISKTAENDSQETKFDLKRDGNGQIRMKAADLIGKDRPLPEEIDRQHKENYLWDDEFQSILGMNRDQFAALRPWKQQQLKQQLGLF